MNKQILMALLLAGMSAHTIAADSPHATKVKLAMYNGGTAELLQPVALEKQTNMVARQRVNNASDALNDKLSKQLEQKFSQNLSDTLL